MKNKTIDIISHLIIACIIFYAGYLFAIHEMNQDKPEIKQVDEINENK